MFFVWLTELETRLRSDEYHPAMQAHLGKYRSLMPTLGMLFQIADDARTLGVGAPEVSPEHARQAALWCEYLESHANRIYSCITTPQMHSARELAIRIRKRQVGGAGSFRPADVYLRGWSSLDTPEAVRGALDVLEGANWIELQEGNTGPKGGRPSIAYLVNPKVWER